MGKGTGKMDDSQKNNSGKGHNKPPLLRQEAQLRAPTQQNSATGAVESNCEHNPPLSPTSPQPGDVTSRLVASTSSPSLLDGCSDSATHAGADVERHLHAHKVDINLIPHTPISPGVQPDFNPQFPENPPDSLFLNNAAIQRSRQNSERPSSAPAHQLERISGTLLRLVGDHYMCSTCGRQLRTMGDQLAFETSIWRTFSASQLETGHNSDYDE